MEFFFCLNRGRVIFFKLLFNFTGALRSMAPTSEWLAPYVLVRNRNFFLDPCPPLLWFAIFRQSKVNCIQEENTCTAHSLNEHYMFGAPLHWR
ncbi:hypothetical protein KC19_VG175400 [Ceratodon purpureus]|uniref:Secreted protein n=1 Tax=Ceratodon purpureus TaxID=3225 RepID=A0A8T0HRK2_CERPU|nr:hypothetical protein KC19_VG175400 [Ceratodon purpureus]